MSRYDHRDYALLGAAQGTFLGGVMLLLATFLADNNEEYTFCISFGLLALFLGAWIWLKLAGFHWTYRD